MAKGLTWTIDDADHMTQAEIYGEVLTQLGAQNEKIMVCRSLSKSYALAGLRFGFLVAQPQVIEQLLKVKDSYNCDALSIAGAVAAVDDGAWLAENRAMIVATRERLTGNHSPSSRSTRAPPLPWRSSVRTQSMATMAER